MKNFHHKFLGFVLHKLNVPADDLLHDFVYRRLWTSILISSFGAQITLLALPLTAAVLLHATPTQMGFLVFTESFPFVLFSLPTGVWLDRVRKLPIYILGESALALTVASVPFAWWMGWLHMPWLYVTGLMIGTVNTIGRQRLANCTDPGGGASSAGGGACKECASQPPVRR